jgi:hypothetical protein
MKRILDKRNEDYKMIGGEKIEWKILKNIL